MSHGGLATPRTVICRLHACPGHQPGKIGGLPTRRSTVCRSRNATNQAHPAAPGAQGCDALFDPIPPLDGVSMMLGDADTGLVATRVSLPERRASSQSRRRGAGDRTTPAAQVGVTRGWETPASLGAEMWTRRYSGAQAAEIDG